MTSAKLENRYRLKFEALHAKRAESERLSRDFERRLLSREVCKTTYSCTAQYCTVIMAND